MLNRGVHVRLNEDDVKRITFVGCVKYLGVSMEVNMNFIVHINNMRRRVESTIGRLRRVLQKEWALKKSVLSVLVKGFIVPAVMNGQVYGMICYG